MGAEHRFRPLAAGFGQQAVCQLAIRFVHIALFGKGDVGRLIVRALHEPDRRRASQPADFTLGERAKVRSVHNSYMTFPLLFIMLSNHFPATYANPLNWLVLLLLFFAGAGVRHAMIGHGASRRWSLVPAVLALAAAMFISTPRGSGATAASSSPPFYAVRAVIEQRCQPC